MENLIFEIQLRPVVDKNGNVRYKKLRILKKRGQKVEVVSKGKLLTFLDTQFSKIEGYLEKERLLVELPLDFLLSKSLIEPLNLSKLNFLTSDPVSRFTKKHAFHLKELLKEYFQNGLEVSIFSKTYDRFKTFLQPLKFSFYCQSPEEEFAFNPLCFVGIDDEETFERVKNRGELFCGKLFGDFETVEEISALSYLQTTIARALELLESEDVKIDELEKLIKTDPQLALSVVKYANSPLIAPPSPIRELRHAIVYLGLSRLQQFLITLMINQMATVDPEFERLALRISAVGFLMERKGANLKKYSKCQLFLTGIVFELQRLFNKPIGQILDMLALPSHCQLPLEDAEVKKLFSEIKEVEIEKTVEELKKILSGTQ